MSLDPKALEERLIATTDAALAQQAPEPVMLNDYLTRYVETRGIPMPFYETGSKIIEEAYELQEAVQLKDRDKVLEESFDVFVTALVAVRQFGGTLEEAAEIKIAKDAGRGLKKDDLNHEEKVACYNPVEKAMHNALGYGCDGITHARPPQVVTADA